MDYLNNSPIYKTLKTEEGYEVLSFNKELSDKFIVPKLTRDKLKELEIFLTEHNTLNIKLGKEGFVSAALREVDGEDDTNYDAVWVRDSSWIYEGLKALGRSEDAKTVILRLWDYYSTKAQTDRMKNIIENPSLSSDAMNCPHIRFDASSPTLDDVFIKDENGNLKRQEWNHKQNDAHGMFLLSLHDAVYELNLTENDITKERAESFALLFQFFDAISYESYEDSGAWEEIDAVRASSIGLVANAHYRWSQTLEEDSSFSKKLTSLTSELKETERSSIENLKSGWEKGLSVVKRHLENGGESPFYDKSSSLHRGADSALLHLLTPYKLEGLEDSHVKEIITLVRSLEREGGILRYENDSYQAMGYVWLKDGQLLHGTSDENFKARAKLFDQFGYGTEPHWFFDSMLACVYLDLAKEAKENGEPYSDLIELAIRGVKRNLGQMTGTHTDLSPITADGEPVSSYLLPESINVILKEGEKRYVTSIIVPLNWPMSSLSVCLKKLKSLI